MSDLPRPTTDEKPLAGSCQHQWQNQKGPYLLAQLCPLCKLFRYKIGATADWEYRAPIPIAPQSGESQGEKT
jgi:hypothetical protein